MAASYRDRERYGAHVYLCRLDDNTTLLDAKGEPERFDFAEATLIDKGFDPAALLARRKPLDKPAPVAEPVEKRGPGRPAKG